jgi:hypothetical protein
VQITATRPGVAGRGVSVLEIRVPERYFQLEPPVFSFPLRRGESDLDRLSVRWLTSFAPSRARLNMRVLEAPPGVSVSFPPERTVGTPDVLVRAAEDAPLGRHVIRVAGEYAGVTETTEWTIDVERALGERVDVLPTRSAHTVVSGGTVTDNVLVSRVLGDPTDPVSLRLSRAPAGVTATFSPDTLRRDSVSLMRLSVARDVPAGTYRLGVLATRGTSPSGATREREITLDVIAPDLQATVAPSDISIPAGTSARVRLTVQRTGVPDTLELQAVSLPGLVVTTLGTTRLADSTTTVDISVPATAPAGTYAMWVRVRGAGIERTAPYRVFVTPPPPPPSNFGVQVSVDSLTLPAGSARRVPLTLSRLGVFVNRVLTLDASAPGLEAWVTASRTTGTTGDLQVVARPTTAPGRYPLVVRARSGDSLRVDTVQVTVTSATEPDYLLLPEQTTVTLQSAGYYAPGPEVLVPIIIARSGGFADAVSLSFPNPPPGVYLNITPSTTSGNLATLSVRTGYGSTPGVLVLTIRGVSGGRVRETQMTLVVP